MKEPSYFAPGASGQYRPRGCRPVLSWLVPIVALLLLGSLAFVHLTALPIFADEGGQLRWIWRIIEAGEWLQPLGDGKPLEAWPMVPLVQLGLPPLAAARALHVLAGMIGAVLTYELALELSDRTTAFISGALFAVCPFVVYLQRFALSDMFMCSAGIWVLASVIKFVESPTWLRTAAVAMALVLAAFCKFPVGFVFLLSAPLAIMLAPAPERRRLLHQPGLTKVLAAHTPVLVLALVVAVSAVVRVRRGQSPGFGLQDFIGIGMGHYRDISTTMGVAPPSLLGELTAQLSWPVTLIGLIGLAGAALLKDWRQRWMIAVGLAPMLAIGTLADFWFSRYLLFTLPPLIVSAVSGWRYLSRRARSFRLPVEFGVLAVCLGFLGHQSALLILNPISANWSPVDRFQYFESPGSGYGFPEAAKFVADSPHAPRMIYSLDGYSAYQLLTYLPAKWIGRAKSIFYGHAGEILRSDDARLDNLFSCTPAWIIVPEQLLQIDFESSFGRAQEDRISLRKITEFDKPGSRARLAIYEVARR